MKNLFLITLLIFSNFVYAEKSENQEKAKLQMVSMNMELAFDGKIISRPRIITILNEVATIAQKEDSSSKELMIEVIPSLELKNKEDFILMKFKVVQKENGTIKWLSTPQILAKNNQQAEISVYSNNQGDEFKEISLKVLPILQ